LESWLGLRTASCIALLNLTVGINASVRSTPPRDYFRYSLQLSHLSLFFGTTSKFAHFSTLNGQISRDSIANIMAIRGLA
jgi:hypothetical protein